MGSKPREIKIWTVLQTSLASLGLVTLSYILSYMWLSMAADLRSKLLPCLTAVPHSAWYTPIVISSASVFMTYGRN